jgi:hypothetical protein
MHTTNEEIAQDLRRAFDQLKTLRDEIRVRLHLGGMEAKERWAKIEGGFDETERAIERLTDDARAKLGELVEAVRDFRRTIESS